MNGGAEPQPRNHDSARRTFSELCIIFQLVSYSRRFTRTADASLEPPHSGHLPISCLILWCWLNSTSLEDPVTMPDIHSLNLSPSSSPTLNAQINGAPNHQSHTGAQSPRSSSVSLAAAATINAGMQQDSRRSSVSSRSNRPPLSASNERRRSNVAMNLALNDPALPGPGEFQSSDSRGSGQGPTSTSSPRAFGSPSIPTRRSRTPSLGELHQELEAEQEAQVVSSLS